MNILYAEAAASFEDLTLGGLDDTLTCEMMVPLAQHDAQGACVIPGSAVDHVQLGLGCGIR